MPETDRFPTFAEWHTANPEPDLRALVEQFGSCRDIPEDAWEIYERQMKDWRAMGRGSSLARGTDAASKVIPERIKRLQAWIAEGLRKAS